MLIWLYQNQISRNLGNLMSVQESKILRIQLYHPFMGVHNFDINSRQNFSDLRAMLSQHTQMTIFENFRFEINGKLLSQFQQIGQVINNQTRINLILQPFDEKSSFYHLQRVKDVLASPIQWVMLNSRQIYEQKQIPNQNLPQGVSIDNFLEYQITSSLYQPLSSLDKHIIFLQQLNFSIHNPPPMYRKLSGDFYYLQVRTLQGNQEHITACPQGFYVNNSSNSCFNTTCSSGIYFYNLLDLFKYLSPKFKQAFLNLKKIFKASQLDKAIHSSFKNPPTCQWLKTHELPKKQKQNQWRYMKVEANINDNNTSIKDWNEIIQLNTILPTDSQAEKTNKQKNQFKIYQDFVSFARDVAVKAVDGLIRPHTNTTPFHRVYYYGTVCIWFAQDDPLDYGLLGHQKGKTRKAINAEIRNLQYLENNRNFNFSLKHMVLVNYKGFDVVVQTVVPGNSNLSKAEAKNNNQSFQNELILEQLSKLLKIQKNNRFKNASNQIERAIIHPDLQNFKGNDDRNYLLNLYALSTRDLSFPGIRNNGTFVRKQLISIFNERQNCQKDTNSMIQSGYSLVFNEKISEQHLKLKSMKSYAQQIMVPLCIQSFLRGNKKYLADSKSVVKVMHKFGLGSRYLGSIYKKSADYEASHIKTVIQRVILVKTLKNIFKHALRKNQLGDIKITLCRLLNCIFCSESALNSMEQCLNKQDLKDEISTNSSRKKKKKNEHSLDSQDDQFSIKIGVSLYSQIKPSQLWEQIKQTILYRYGLKLQQPKICMLKCLQNMFGKYSLLRDLCINVGITLQKQQYFQKQQGLIFKPDNIQELKPIVKNITHSNKYLESLIQQGENLIERKKIEQAIDIYNQAINYATSNFGVMTEQLSSLNKKIAEIYFRIGEIDAALLFVQCAQKMCQKIYGESHVQTIQCYNLLSQFSFFLRNFQTAQYYLMKAIHISTVSFGQQYPQLIIGYLNLSSIYEATSRYMDSITSVSQALRIVLRVFGQDHINTAICYAAMSTAHFQIPDIQKSIFFQQKSIETLSKILKSEDLRLKQAHKVLQYYNHLQSSKKVRQNYQKQRKRIITNPQLYAGFPLFRMPQHSLKDRQHLFRKMQSMIQFPNKYFI